MKVNKDRIKRIVVMSLLWAAAMTWIPFPFVNEPNRNLQAQFLHFVILAAAFSIAAFGAYSVLGKNGRDG